jgi:hypothetical protein
MRIKAMAEYRLIELSRSRDVTGSGVVVEDYTDHPTLCRYGVWVGTRTFFTERVVLSFEHDPDPLNVTWRLQDAENPLNPPYDFTPNGPVIGAPGIRYSWPVDHLQHRIALFTEPGAKPILVTAQVVYSPEAGGAVTNGPELALDMSGEVVSWPARQLLEEAECKKRWADLLSRYAKWHKPLPGEPVEWIDQIQGSDARRVIAVTEALDSLDPASEGELVAAIQADLTRIVLGAQLRAARRGRG